ncbi:MAG TPA: M48 family metalloprotease [Frankiaceae bacterium]|nr:M48 family metalloprotease [Frankiaceae bacterium]
MDDTFAVPGPGNRESFHDQQVRHRRASGWFTLLSANAVGLMGVPLAAVVSPLLYAVALLALDLVNLVVDMPDPLSPLGSGGSSGDLSPRQWVVVALALVIPGTVALLLTWLGVRRVFAWVGSGTAVLALGAREPSGELEERQLRNVVDEMAAAAGIPAPRVAILDSDVPNAAAVGGRIDDATLVVTTGLLATLDRAETQAVVGHLVGSVGNGDLRIGTTLASVFQTLGLVETVLRSPGERAPRRTLRRLVRYAFRRPGADDTADAARVLLTAGTTVEVENEPAPGPVRSVLTLPFVAAGMSFAMTRMIFGWLVVNPFLRRAWRSRKHLADATAVQLTRDPGALGRALATLAERGGVVPGTEWASYLFVVGREARDAKDPDTVSFNAPVRPRLERLRAMGADVTLAAKPVYTRAQRAMLVAVVVVTSPCWLTMLGVLLACAIVLTLVSLAIDALFLAPVVAVLHALLR